VLQYSYSELIAAHMWGLKKNLMTLKIDSDSKGFGVRFSNVLLLAIMII
jgi:hypothetical protein